MSYQMNPLLSVPYYSQLDSNTRHGRRMCFSSCCAMLLQSLMPSTLTGQNGDDEYLKRVFQYGDTVRSTAQIQALRSYGLDASFYTNLDWAQVDAQLAAGIPVPVGILHRGHVSAPSGFGHWIIIIGKKSNDTGTTADDQYFVHDPAGELDLINGVYLHNDGQKKLYSRKNLGPRWRVNGTGGWGVIVRKP